MLNALQRGATILKKPGEIRLMFENTQKTNRADSRGMQQGKPVT
jgi:hypothetical protein